MGILSLIVWTLVVVVTVKYVLILLQADNKGEGGTLALMALARGAFENGGVIVLLGIISGALFYGDAIITPALSVLSAIEGLKIVTPTFDPYVVPLTVVILVVLFTVQSRGTAKVAAFFGPITLFWFAALTASIRDTTAIFTGWQCRPSRMPPPPSAAAVKAEVPAHDSSRKTPLRGDINVRVCSREDDRNQGTVRAV